MTPCVGDLFIGPQVKSVTTTYGDHFVYGGASGFRASGSGCCWVAPERRTCAGSITVEGELLLYAPDGAVIGPQTDTLWLSDFTWERRPISGHGVPIGSEPTLETLHRLRERIKPFKPRGCCCWGFVSQRHQSRNGNLLQACAGEFRSWSGCWFGATTTHSRVLLREVRHPASGPAGRRGLHLYPRPADLARWLWLPRLWARPPRRSVCAVGGRQSPEVALLPFGQQQAVMPAYGAFTGMHVDRPGQNGPGVRHDGRRSSRCEARARFSLKQDMPADGALQASSHRLAKRRAWPGCQSCGVMPSPLMSSGQELAKSKKARAIVHVGCESKLSALL